MNRNAFRILAAIRLKEARTLLQNGNFEGAYYLRGYVVECGLKACIAKLTQKYEFPDKKQVNASYTHNLVELVKAAGLETDLQTEIQNDPQFELNWITVRGWSEESRYQIPTRQAAEFLFAAIIRRKHGVLRWIKKFW